MFIIYFRIYRHGGLPMHGGGTLSACQWRVSDYWHTTQHAGATAKVVNTTTYLLVRFGGELRVSDGDPFGRSAYTIEGNTKVYTHCNCPTDIRTYVRYCWYTYRVYICKQKYTSHTSIYCMHIRTYVRMYVCAHIHSALISTPHKPVWSTTVHGVNYIQITTCTQHLCMHIN